MSNSSAQSVSPPKLAWRGLLFVTLYVASLDLVALGSRTLTYHEALYAQPAREMLASGDWIQPRLAGVPCNQKPPLTTWLIAISMATCGQSEWAIRLPSVFASAWLAAAVAGLAARWLGVRVGIAAGIVQGTSFYVLRQARAAEADIILCLAVATAMSIFALGVVDTPAKPSRRRWLPVGFYLATALAFLAKGPIGPLFILSACGLFAVIERKDNIWRFLIDPVGLALFVAGTMAWPLAVYTADPAIVQDWRLHHLGRFSGELGRKDALYYLYTLPAVLLPWTPAVVLGVWCIARRGWWRSPQAKLMLCWMLPGLLVVSLCAFKRKHYTAPLLPPLSLAAAIGLIYLLGYRSKKWKWQISAFTLIWLAVAVLEWRVTASNDVYRPQLELATRIQQLVPSSEAISLIHMPENQISFYLNRPMVRHDRGDGYLRWAKDGSADGQYVLAPERIVKRLEKVVAVERLDACHPDAPEGLRLTFIRIGRPLTNKTKQARGKHVPVSMVESLSDRDH